MSTGLAIDLDVGWLLGARSHYSRRTSLGAHMPDAQWHRRNDAVLPAVAGRTEASAEVQSKLPHGSHGRRQTPALAR